MKLQARRLYSKSRQCLEDNMGVGAVLTLVVVLAYFCMLMAGGLLSILLSTMMLDVQLTPSLSLSAVLGSACTLVLSLFIIFPLRLSIKGWYQRLGGGFVPAALAFVIFTSPKRYWRAFCFGMVGFFSKLLSFIVCMLPCFFVSGMLKYSFLQIGIDQINLPLALLAMADFLLLLLGVAFGFFVSVRFFYMDYLFLLGKEKTPFKAMSTSFKLYKENKRELLKAICAIIPHLAACILIVPIPFAIPKLAAIMAIHAQATIQPNEKKDNAFI